MMEQAIDLHPDSWAMFRQFLDLQEAGKSFGPEYWARVRAKLDEPYYPKIDMPGMPH